MYLVIQKEAVVHSPHRWGPGLLREVDAGRHRGMIALFACMGPVHCTPKVRGDNWVARRQMPDPTHARGGFRLKSAARGIDAVKAARRLTVLYASVLLVVGAKPTEGIDHAEYAAHVRQGLTAGMPWHTRTIRRRALIQGRVFNYVEIAHEDARPMRQVGHALLHTLGDVSKEGGLLRGIVVSGRGGGEAYTRVRELAW